MTPEDTRIAEALMDLAHRRSTARSFCPSEAARALSEDWHAVMPEVRRVAATLPLVATQKAAPVDPVTARGPNRLRLAP